MVAKIGDFLDDGELNTPKYMLGRKTIDNELEVRVRVRVRGKPQP